MQIVGREVIHRPGDRIRLFFVPSQPEGEIDAATDALTVVVDGVLRQFSVGVLKMMQRFNSTLRSRERLRHDCGVFALACLTGNSHDEQMFHGENGLALVTKMFAQRFTIPADRQVVESALPTGGVIKTILVDANGVDVPREHHYLVRVSADGVQPPLYASKLGMDGPVVIHDFDTSLRMYPAQCMQVVIGMHAKSWAELAH